MKLSIEINLDNSAYACNPEEVQENLMDIIKKINWGDAEGIVFDSNGNKTGNWEITE